MSFLSKLSNILPGTETKAFSKIQQYAVGYDGVTLYPFGDDDTKISEGYNKNAWVYAIVSKCAKKFSQVPWYHYRIKNSERKTWSEYVALTKSRPDTKGLIEARKMRVKSVDQVIVDSAVSKLLSNPNSTQTGAEFREQLYGYKLLTGEGNIWLNRMSENMPPQALYIIPKKYLAIIKGETPWSIDGWKIDIRSVNATVPKDDMISWKFANYDFNEATLSHLRGMSPLTAGLLLLQASNDGAERLISMNQNQGVAGLAYRKDQHAVPTPEQAIFQRKQFNSIVNDKDLAGTIAVMNGEWGYLQFGLDAGQLKLMEQADIHFKTLCNIFDVPWQLFGNADSYENRRQYKRDFVYDNIAVAAYGLRDELNNELIPEFGLDRDRDVIDCDLMALPELSDDLKTQTEAIRNVWQLTPNDVLEYLGFDRKPDPLMDKVYIPNSLTPLDQADLGAPLDGEVQQLGI